MPCNGIFVCFELRNLHLRSFLFFFLPKKIRCIARVLIIEILDWKRCGSQFTYYCHPPISRQSFRFSQSKCPSSPNHRSKLTVAHQKIVQKRHSKLPFNAYMHAFVNTFYTYIIIQSPSNYPPRKFPFIHNSLQSEISEISVQCHSCQLKSTLRSIGKRRERERERKNKSVDSKREQTTAFLSLQHFFFFFIENIFSLRQCCFQFVGHW